MSCSVNSVPSSTKVTSYESLDLSSTDLRKKAVIHASKSRPTITIFLIPSFIKITRHVAALQYCLMKCS